jgi:hypothetical protein
VSAVYNPESDVIAEIERLELEARDMRRKIEHVHSDADRRALNRLLADVRDRIEYLRQRLP